MKTDIEEGELSIDIPGLSIFTKAKYEIASIWDGGKLTDATVALTDWECDGAWRSRFDLAAIVGMGRVLKVECDFGERWAETAEANARDAHADLYRRDEEGL